MDTLDSNGYIMSGDKGKIDANGFLKITGRIKELIITAGGENVAPVPIEDNFKTDIDMKTGLPSRTLLPETVAFFKNELGLSLKTSDEAIAEPKVSEFIKKCIEKTNQKSVSRAAHMRKFKLLADDFSIPGGELTPTMKLKRKVTEQKYKEFVDQMFAPEAK